MQPDGWLDENEIKDVLEQQKIQRQQMLEKQKLESANEPSLKLLTRNNTHNSISNSIHSKHSHKNKPHDGKKAIEKEKIYEAARARIFNKRQASPIHASAESFSRSSRKNNNFYQKSNQRAAYIPKHQKSDVTSIPILQELTQSSKIKPKSKQPDSNKILYDPDFDRSIDKYTKRYSEFPDEFYNEIDNQKINTDYDEQFPALS